MKRLFRIAVVFAVLLGVSATDARAAEARCNALGTNCICSEPLNTNSMGRSGAYYNPGDSTTKECRGEIGTAQSFYFNGTMTAAGSGTAPITALPSGNTVSYAWSAPEGHIGTIGPWHFFPGGTPPNRNVSARFYTYLSPNFSWNNEYADCGRGKFWYFGTAASPNMLWHQSVGTGNGWGIANFINTTANVDCCNTGPMASPAPSFTGASFKGRWTRHEIVFQNANQPSGLVIRVYKQTLGVDSQNVLVIDTSRDSRLNGMQLDGGLLGAIKATMYGERSCSGYTAFSHFMVAGWDGEYAGQLIGPAAEIESGAVDTVAPAPPTNVGVQ